MSMKETLDQAKSEIAAGVYPKRVLADNTKTGVTILDNVPQLTCYGACPIRRKCYDVKILKLRRNVLLARARRHFLMASRPEVYTRMAVGEILAGGYSKVRVYGGGDFAPHHMPIMIALLRALPGVTFYMISKTIRSYPAQALALLAEPNFFLDISECEGYIFGPEWDEIATHARVNRVYTLLEGDKNYDAARARDIVFNVSKAKANILSYKAEGLPLCPCDTHDIPAAGACGACNLCSVKGGVKGATFTGRIMAIIGGTK